MANRQSIADRFESKIVRIPESGCWIWMGSLHVFGYGLFYLYADGKSTTKTVHRMSWEIHVGSIPDKEQVNHRCDVPQCCNPHHMFLGSQKDNIQDMHEKGRDNHPSGARNHSKLTEDQARQVRDRVRAGESVNAVAQDFGVSGVTAWKIGKGLKWAHLE